MKEIKTSNSSTLPHIVGDQITIKEAMHRCTSESGYCMIMSIIHHEAYKSKWFQLIDISDDGSHVYVHEQHRSYLGFHRVAQEKTFERFISDMQHNYPDAEFYLIEGMQDIFKILKERIPNWLPSEYQQL